MSVEDRAKELNNLAERIKGSFTNFNSEFKKLSQKTTRIQRNIAERKERGAKLKSTSSSFGRSVDNVKSKVLSGPQSILGKVLGFASLLLFGVTLANIFKVDKKLDNETEKMKETSENTGNFITGMTDGVKGFMGSFSELYKKTDGTFDDLDSKVKDAERELGEFNRESDQYTDFELKDVFTNSATSDEGLTEEEEEKIEDDGVDSIFKKPPANSFRDNVTDKNALKTKDEFEREGLELRKTRGTTTTEKREIRLSESLLSEIKSSDLNISDSLQFETLEGGAMIDGKEYKGDIIIITKDRIIK
tara:strand:- start:421 stop:1332 length:912 start_codon:yes stop_codon:yes gene_type:complete